MNIELLILKFFLGINTRNKVVKTTLNHCIKSFFSKEHHRCFYS